MENKTVYFEKLANENTAETLILSKQRADELGIKTIIVASTRGDTGVKAAQYFKGYTVIVVRIATGYWEANVQLFPDDKVKLVEQAGAKIVTSAPAFSEVARTPNQNFHLHDYGDIIANTLRIFGQGMKVVCEIALQAVDAGLVRSGEPVISIAGSGSVRGADTAVVLTAVNSNRFFDMKVHEIICKPRL
ncbi:MAG TPA: pyruvate kinase alpha/beta domain-containing protein [Dehalococcoidales bacterium]|nr:pyruvate kinase alpha/beta domain-containing protein [Dehalococcoidales bacterium]